MQEKLRVLTLLEEGKITAREAIELLEALNLSKDASCKEKCSADFEEKMKDFGKNVEQFAKEIGEKLNDTAKIIEPKIKSATQSMLEKASNLINEMSNALKDDDNNTCCSKTNSCQKEIIPEDEVADETDDDQPLSN